VIDDFGCRFLVDLPLLPRQRLLRLGAGAAGLAEADVVAGQRVGAGVDEARKLPEGNGSM
jgi:hypothetical protein